MQRLSSFFALCLAVASCPPGALAQTRCSTPGAVVCDTACENLVVCLGNGEGGYREETVETCDAEAGTHCYAPARRCEARNSCENPTEQEFECTSVGQFPNPVDCQSYYICAPDPVPTRELRLVAHKTPCETGYAYNSSRGFCNLPLDHVTCVQGPVPGCTEVGAVGSLPENTSIYYVCKRRDDLLHPVLFLCPHGDSFNDTTATCVASLRRSLDAFVVPPWP